MGTLDDTLSGLLADTFSLEKLAPTLVFREIKRQGITLTPKQKKDITAQIVSGTLDKISLNLSKSQLLQAGITKDHVIDVSGDDVQRDMERLESLIIEMLPSILKSVSIPVTKTLLRQQRELNSVAASERIGFEKRLSKRWGKALNLYEMLLHLCIEAGGDCNNELRATIPEGKGHTLDVITRLHARGCQVGQEILSLLRGGFADGAMARWRTLHEITVTAAFISKHGDETAQRYLDYNAILADKASRKYQLHYPELGLPPITDQELVELKTQRVSVVNRYGEVFANEYGWALSVLEKERATFADLEKDVGLDHFRPYYTLASHNVHADAHGMLFHLGSSENDENYLLAGPSNIGLADPGENAAISLLIVTTTLLTFEPNVDRLVQCNVLTSLRDKVIEAFAKVGAIKHP